MTIRMQAWHGWGFDPAAFDQLRAALGDGYQLVTPALTAPASGDFNAWVAKLAGQVSANEVLLGWSLGAMLAMAAVAAGARPRALVLIGASPRFVASAAWPHGLDASTVTAFQTGIAAQPDRTMKRFLALQTLGDSQRSAGQAALEHALETDPAKLSPALSALIGADLRTQVRHIGVPALLLHGENDALMPMAAANWLSAQLPHAQLQLFPQCGHAPHVTHARGVAEALQRFLGALPDA